MAGARELFHSPAAPFFQPDQYFDVPPADLLSWTFGNPPADPDKAIFLDVRNAGRRISYRQAKRGVRRLISGLQAHGLQRGDCVCVQAFNSIWYPLLYLAVVGAGGRFLGVNPSFTTQELEHVFSITQPSFAFVEGSILGDARSNFYRTKIRRRNLFSVGGVRAPTGFQSWRRLLLHGQKDWIRIDNPKESENTIATIHLSSGTSGLPKAAEISHYAHIATSVSLYDAHPKAYLTKRLLCLPFFHAFAAPLIHVAPLREGHPTYVMRRFDVRDFADAVWKHQITETAVVPPMAIKFLNSGSDTTRLLSPLRSVICAGAPLDTATQLRFADKLGPEANFTQCWGMTEISRGTAFLHAEQDATGSVGRLIPNMEAKILDHDGTAHARENHRGEILIRGPSLMSGYAGDPEATEQAFHDGWLRTGDIGYCDAGKWYIVDRAKDLIKVRAWQVAPAELEACLLTHPGVADVAVVGVADAEGGGGELPRAFVVRREGSTVTEGEVRGHFVGKLAGYKALGGGVEFVEAIPRNASGKILRYRLKG